MKKVGVVILSLLMASMVIGCVPAPTPSPVPSPTPAPTPAESEEFAIYLLAGDIPATELSAQELSALQLQEEPIVSAEDVFAYSRKSHELELTAEAYGRIRELFALPVRVQGIPFVVVVGTERIYAGAFMTPASSISFDGVVILEPFEADRHVITIGLGYPTPEAFTGDDPRSDPRVFESLEALGKLK